MKILPENYSNTPLVERLRTRARIRRQIPTRKSVQEGKRDSMADLLEEAANEIERLQERVWEVEDWMCP
jgi:hypothetical protein